MAHSSIAIDVILILASATFISILFHTLKIPAIVGFLGTGMLIGPYGLNLLSDSIDTNLMLELGAVLLMFTLGLEFSFKRLWELKRMLLNLGALQILMTTILVFGVCFFLLNLSETQSIVLGFIVSLSSTATVLKLLQDSRESDSPYGQGVISVLLAQDVAVIPMMLLIGILGVESFEWSQIKWASLLIWVAKIGGATWGIYFASQNLIPFIIKRAVLTQSREVFFFCLLSLCLGVAIFFEWVGLSLSFGAFVAGVVISESAYGKQATSVLVPFRDNFLSLFFIAIGMLVDLNFVANYWAVILMLFVGLVAVKVPGVYWLARRQHFPPTLALFIAMILFQIGEFSFILSGLALKTGVLDQSQIQYILSLSVLSLALTPLLFRWSPKLKIKDFIQIVVPQEMRDQTRSEATDSSLAPAANNLHTIIVGFGVAGQNLATALKSLGVTYKIIEMNPQTVEKFKAQGEPIFFGDASRREILEQVDIEHSRLVVITVTGKKILEPILNQVHSIRPNLHVILRTEYLRDATPFLGKPYVEPVIGEFETTLEILSRALGTYGVSSREIYKFMLSSHKQMLQSHGAFSDSLRQNLSLPTWDALSAIQPVSVAAQSLAHNKSLVELDFRKETGTSIVLVHRPTLGSTVPQADFILEAGDVVYLMGDTKSVQKAEELLSAPFETSMESP